MNFEVHIKNLGKVGNATIPITPLTIITGANGSGKSFFTKSLYSILTTLNKNLFRDSINQEIAVIDRLLQILTENLSRKSKTDIEEIDLLREATNEIQQRLEELNFLDLESYLLTIKKLEPNTKRLKRLLQNFEKRIKGTKTKFASIEHLLQVSNQRLVSIEKKITNSPNSYYEFIISRINNELNSNFQIKSSNELISFKEDFATISIDRLFEYQINRGSNNDIDLKLDFSESIRSLNEIVFFESPAYWKVREALIYRQDVARFENYENRILTGVPKYFYDLDRLFNLNLTTTGKNEFEHLAKKIEEILQGSFKFDKGTLTYIDNITSREIPKNLISFGMTNLGMIHALLQKEIITRGSFIFIDEPESNLHPEWQILLAEILVELANNGVNVVIATHSSDMLKALEVNLKEKDLVEDKSFISTTYFTNNGGLLELDGELPIDKLNSARAELLKPYQRMNIRKQGFFDD